MVQERKPIEPLKPLEFPAFPTLFGEKEVTRLKKLEEQRIQIERIYQGKFTPEAWAKVPLPEKAVREFLPSWLSPVARVLTPWEEGTWDIGFTPEQAQEYRFNIEEEYKELVRKQKVTRLLPLVKDALRALALTEEGIITDAGELRSIFKLGEMGFSEEEMGYVTEFAQRLLWATPEEIATGQVLGMRPLSPQDVEELARAGVEPRYILTTVSLSQRKEDITAALQEMYAPQVEDPTGRERAIAAFVESLKVSGITKETTRELFDKTAGEEGEILILTDEQTGSMISASKRADGTVWFEGELLGSYDTEQQRVVPIDINTGKPLATEEAQESVIKDLVDSFYLGMTQAWYGTRQALFNVVPHAIASFFAPATEEQLIAEGIDPEMMRGVREGLGRLTTGIIETVQQRAEVRQAEYEVWLKEHPELVPRPEYLQSSVEHPELLSDPYFYAYVVISNAPVIGAALLVGIATTVVTKNPWAGAVAAAAVITPVQINSVYEDLIANGADPGNATELATGVGILMGAVEIIPGMIVLKVASPVFMKIFRQNLQKEVTKQLTKRLIVKGVLTTATKIEVAETLEEVIQEAMQNAAVKTVNENRSIIENLPETAINAAIATAPLAFFGGGASYMGMKAQLPQKVQDEIDTTTAKMEDAGLSPEHAEAVAFGKLVETEEGQAQVEIAAEKADEVAPVVEEKPNKIEDIETKLTTISSDIEAFTGSIELQEDRLTKLTLPFERAELSATIEGLREQLSELEAKKTGIVKNLGMLKKPVVTPEPVVVPEPVPETLVTPDPDAGKELSPDRRPRLKDWGDDQRDTDAALKAAETISKRIVPPTVVRLARTEAERNLESLHTRLTEARDNEEETKVVTDEFEDLAERSRLSKKKLLASSWNDLSPPEQTSLVLAAIPDKSVTFPTKREIFDIRYYMQFLEEETGLPFYTLFKRAEISHGAARIAGEDMLRRIGGDPHYTQIRTDEAALLRVAQEINARNPALKMEHPEGLTDEERSLANSIGDVYEHYKPIVRYLRFMRTAPNLNSLKDTFPDAVESGKEVELSIALELRNAEDLNGLYSYLESLDWGVIQTGYDPWLISHPTLVPTRVSLGTTRGAARFMRRETVDYTEAGERNVLLRLALYIKQVEAQWRLEPELDVLEGLWKQVGSKFTNMGQIESALREWTRELQGIPTRQSFLDSVLRRVWRQAMSSVFLHPWMSFRNMHQALAFHPDRTELFKLLVQKPSASVQEMSRIYYDTFVSQLKGIRRDWLYAGERGLPGLGWLTRLSDTLSLYSHSDNIPRWWSFQASMNKAMGATEQYQKDGDVIKWLKASGANHLRQTERNYALQLLAQPTFDLAVPGLREVTGGEMASMYIGHEVANMTHFIYERAFRAPVEIGATGKTLYNLIVFPRGYFQRVYFQAKKLPNPSEVFSSEVDWTQARAGFKDLILMLIVGAMISEWLKKVSGKRRRPYNPLDIIQWQLGGLVIGVGMDVTELIGNFWTLIDPTADPEVKSSILGGLPGKLARQADTLIPFYRSLLDSYEAFAPYEWLGSNKDIDRHLIRQLRAKLDTDYTPEEMDEMDRNLWEKLRKAVFAGEPPDPTEFQNIQEALIENEARLGEMDAAGRFYTLRQFAGDIRTLTKPLPDDMLHENYNFSDLVLFYKESEDSWEEFYKLPSSPASVRQEWRESHVLEEATLLFWGMYAKSIFRLGTPEWEEVHSVLVTWFSLYRVDKRMHSYYADWTEVPPKSLE